MHRIPWLSSSSLMQMVLKNTKLLQSLNDFGNIFAYGAKLAMTSSKLVICLLASTVFLFLVASYIMFLVDSYI